MKTKYIKPSVKAVTADEELLQMIAVSKTMPVEGGGIHDDTPIDGGNAWSRASHHSVWDD